MAVFTFGGTITEAPAADDFLFASPGESFHSADHAAQESEDR